MYLDRSDKLTTLIQFSCTSKFAKSYVSGFSFSKEPLGMDLSFGVPPVKRLSNSYIYFFYFGFGQLRSKAVERRRTTLSRKTAVLLAAVLQFQARKARTVQHIRYFFVLTNKSESWLWHVHREIEIYYYMHKKPASIFQSSKSRF